MIPYKDINNDSDIESYDFTKNGIKVKFKNKDGCYKYETPLCTEVQVFEMRKFAEKGTGLLSYIMKNCPTKYKICNCDN